MERLCKLLSEVETDEVSDIQNEHEYVLQENFSTRESFSEHDTESEEDGDPGNVDVNNTSFSQGIVAKKALPGHLSVNKNHSLEIDFYSVFDPEILNVISLNNIRICSY
ncbi:hypothetical protein AVEN_25465-1 [Araneus ventricosus]|uniref:Uncharacterized protein n=1 Tax=Araneus ventricosus TaxID=182803 RepID=A0A4Y2N5M7_ARAVE|nr:hypothetical protein AVEN_25465-1 [Araneus ventricosus]